jgi:beta-galactosidase/beta-glucuronidase
MRACEVRVFARVARLVLWLAVSVGGTARADESLPAIDAEPLGSVSEGAVVLHANWQMRESALAGDDGAAISQAGFSAEGWYRTSVPTTALGTLVRHGVYPNPYVGMNNMQIPDASDAHNVRYGLARWSHLPGLANPWAKPYWFRTEFRVPSGFLGQAAWLHLDGLNYRADVWLNGRQVGEAKSVVGMFRRFRFEVSSLLRVNAANALAVRIHPLDHPGDPVHEQVDGLAGGYGPNGGDGEILRDVTQYCAIGWDWVPAARDRNMGLWQHVWLEAAGPVAVRDPAAMTEVKLPEADEAKVTLRCQLDNATATEQVVELIARITPEGWAGTPVETRATFAVAANTNAEVSLEPSEHPALVLRNPRLWWPATYGEHPLYRLSVEARVGGRSSSVASSRFGVRSVGSVIMPSGGRAFTVNGRVIRLTGGAWVPDFLMSWSAQRYRDEVRLMAEGNHTVVRVNGCGIVAPDVFYDECDRRGLLVWQDLSRTSIHGGQFRKDGKDGWGPVDCDEPATYLSNMADCIRRLRGHPSLLVWCGSNEKFPQANVGEPLQDDVLPTLDGTRPWLPSSDENPPWGKEETRVWSGGPYHLVHLPEYFKLYATDPKFTSRNEIGLASPPSINSIVKAIPDFDQPDPQSFPLNRAFGYHDATDNYYRKSDTLLRQDLAEPTCLTEYLWMGDLYSGLSYRAIYEAANKVRPRNAGTHIWKINAAWPSVVQQVFDWYLRCNGGYYAMRSACRPLHVQHSVDDHTLQVVSTLAEPRAGLKVRATLLDAAGRVEQAQEHTLTAAADATTHLGPVPEQVKDGRLHFLALDLLGPDGQELDRVVTWVQHDCRFHELMKLPPADIEARVTGRSEQDGEACYTVSVHNTSSVPATHVWLEVIRGPQGEEILPAYWSDNAMTLVPGERRIVTVRFRANLLGADMAHLMVEGWNVTPREWSAADGQAVSLACETTACDVAHQEDGVALRFAATQRGAVGPRWTTWPLPVRLDGNVVRWVRMGLKTGVASPAHMTLPNSPPGKHRVAVGNGPGMSFDIP